MKVDVGQKRTDHRPLRCAAARPPFLHLLDDVLMQIGLDQLKHPAIAHTLLYALHKPPMRNRVEVAPQVGIHHKGVALSNQSVPSAKPLFAPKTGTKPITHLKNPPQKDGPNHKLKPRLYDAVFNYRYPQSPHFSFLFGSPPPPHRHRPVGS